MLGVTAQRALRIFDRPQNVYRFVYTHNLLFEYLLTIIIKRVIIYVYVTYKTHAPASGISNSHFDVLTLIFAIW